MIYTTGQPKLLKPQEAPNSRLDNEHVWSEKHRWLRGFVKDGPDDWNTELAQVDISYKDVKSVSYVRIYLPANAPPGSEVVVDDGNGGFVRPNTTIVFRIHDKTQTYIVERRRLFFFAPRKRPPSIASSVLEFVELHKSQGFAFRRFEDGTPVYWI
jgi:hypothetical protein